MNASSGETRITVELCGRLRCGQTWAVKCGKGDRRRSSLERTDGSQHETDIFKAGMKVFSPLKYLILVQLFTQGVGRCALLQTTQINVLLWPHSNLPVEKSQRGSEETNTFYSLSDEFLSTRFGILTLLELLRNVGPFRNSQFR